MTRADTAKARAEKEALKDRLVEGTLRNAAFDGWTAKSLLAAAGAAGIDRKEAQICFPGGMLDVARHAAAYFDRRMLERLESRDLEAMKVRERVAAGVMARIEAMAPHREGVRRLLSFMALPGNNLTATRHAWQTCSAIWYAAGDQATDFNYYSKRGLLFSVYTQSVLYWLNDRSEDFADTRAFIERRIADVMRIPKYQARLRDAVSRLPDPFRLLRRTGA